MVVEDVEAERLLMSMFLHEQGCRVFHAVNGLDAIHKARLVMPDLILMDADMPECDGYAASKAITQDPLLAHIPVVFLSGHAHPQERIQGLLAGAVDYIAKPFVFDEVLLRLSIHLRRSHSVPAEPVSEQSPTDIHSLESRIFQSARVHLLAALRQPPELQQLAELVGTNTKRLNEAFKTCAGMTVFEYLREERMREARQLLGSTRLSIADIASSIGYTNSAHFATAFKERFGITPSQCRRS